MDPPLTRAQRDYLDAFTSALLADRDARPDAEVELARRFVRLLDESPLAGRELVNAPLLVRP